MVRNSIPYMTSPIPAPKKRLINTPNRMPLGMLQESLSHHSQMDEKT
ncbi:MAG: hypothetical protein VX027_04655 [Bacteroidota bacterium]|nr:hypothetical protein [Bacteroidota bacterium]